MRTSSGEGTNVRLLAAMATVVVLTGFSCGGTAGAQSACADLGATVDPNQICRGHIVTSDYTLDLSFPVSYPDEQALTDYLIRRGTNGPTTPRRLRRVAGHRTC